MSRSPALTAPSYPHQFSGVLKEALEYNARWAIQVIAWKETYKNQCDYTNTVKDECQRRQAAGEIIGIQQWQALDRMIEEQSVALGRNRTTQEQLDYSLKLTTDRLLSLWTEIKADYHDDELSEAQYKAYMTEYWKCLVSGKDISHYQTEKFQEVKREVEKFLPVDVKDSK